MPIQELDLDTEITIELNGFGRHILDAATMTDAAREFESTNSIERPIPRSVSMPLWEAIRIFGPHINASVRQPIRKITFARPPSEAEGSERDLKLRLDSIVRKFADVMIEIGASSRGCYDLEKDAQRWLSEAPPRVPNAPGYWVRRNHVERVMWAGTGSCRHLAVLLRNNRMRNVEDFDPDEWEGPAVRDPRVKHMTEDGDEDIPF